MLVFFRRLGTARQREQAYHRLTNLPDERERRAVDQSPSPKDAQPTTTPTAAAIG